MGRLIARGGMGSVFAAEIAGVEGFSRPVALKRIYAHLGENERYRKMFIREAKIASELDHPNITQIYELGEHDGELFIAMEFVRGVDLGRLLKAMHPDPLVPELVAVIGFDILEALDYAHTRSPVRAGRPLVHQDISPQNILVSAERGMAKLCDFGVVQVSEGSGSLDSVTAGKVAYMSPEQIRGEPLTPASDLYSVSLVLYELLTSTQARVLKPGAAGVLEAATQETLTQLTTSNIPAGFASILAKGTQPAKEARYTSAAAYRQDLERFLSSYNPREARSRLVELVTAHLPELSLPQDSPATRPQTADGGTTAAWNALVLQAESVGSDAIAPRERRRRAAVATLGLVAAILIAVLGWSSTRAFVSTPIGEDQTKLGVRPEPKTPDPSATPPIRSTETQKKVIGPKETGAGTSTAPTRTRRGTRSAKKSRVRRRSPTTPAARSVVRDESASANTHPVRKGELTLGSHPWSRVVLDGVLLEGTTPLRGVRVKAGRHTIEFRRPDGSSETRTVVVRPDETHAIYVEF
ncbi:MAG: serine/threonine-protein kinase [Myxococcota bacterium]